MRKTVSCHSERSEESAAVMREEKQGLYKFITAILFDKSFHSGFILFIKTSFLFRENPFYAFFPDEWHLLYYLSFHNIQDNKRDIF